MKAKIVISLALLLGALGCVQSADGGKEGQKRFKDASVEEFAKLVADTNHVVLDVRTPREYAAGHIAGAVNLDWNSAEFAAKVAKLDPGKTYLVHCAGGRRSSSACQKMGELGFTNLVNLQQGFRGWESAGKPVQK